jgi:hypothetical protein
LAAALNFGGSDDVSGGAGGDRSRHGSEQVAERATDSRAPQPFEFSMIFQMASKAHIQNSKQRSSQPPQIIKKTIGQPSRSRGTTFLLGQTSKSKQIVNYKSGKFLGFEFALNFKGVQKF